MGNSSTVGNITIAGDVATWTIQDTDQNRQSLLGMARGLFADSPYIVIPGVASNFFVRLYPKGYETTENDENASVFVSSTAPVTVELELSVGDAIRKARKVFVPKPRGWKVPSDQLAHLFQTGMSIRIASCDQIEVLVGKVRWHVHYNQLNSLQKGQAARSPQFEFPGVLGLWSFAFYPKGDQQAINGKASFFLRGPANATARIVVAKGDAQHSFERHDFSVEACGFRNFCDAVTSEPSSLVIDLERIEPLELCQVSGGKAKWAIGLLDMPANEGSTVCSSNFSFDGIDGEWTMTLYPRGAMGSAAGKASLVVHGPTEITARIAVAHGSKRHLIEQHDFHTNPYCWDDFSDLDQLGDAITLEFLDVLEQVSVDGCTASWKIKYEHPNVLAQHALTSPSFNFPEFPGAWSLTFYPRGDGTVSGKTSLYLFGPEHMTATFMFFGDEHKKLEHADFSCGLRCSDFCAVDAACGVLVVKMIDNRLERALSEAEAARTAFALSRWSLGRDVYAWQFESAAGVWTNYDETASLLLEQTHSLWQENPQESSSILHGVQCGKWSYDINLNSMTQKQTTTGKTRCVRRVLSDIGVLKTAVSQQTETIENLSSTVRRHEQEIVQLSRQRNEAMLAMMPCPVHLETRVTLVDKDDPKYQALEILFKESLRSHRDSIHGDVRCEAPKVVVSQIRSIRNPSMQQQYINMLRIVQDRNARGCAKLPMITALKCVPVDGVTDVNEYLLFHGTPWSKVDTIASTGLDPQRGGETVGRMYGVGTYFAENASKSDMYTTCAQCRSDDFRSCKHPCGERCMLVVRVILGQSYRALNRMPQLTKAPDRENGWPYDSVWAEIKNRGGSVDHPEYIVYKEQQALAQYIIHYKHEISCKCAMCPKRG